MLEIESGVEMVEKYNNGLADLAARLGKDVPVVDGEVAVVGELVSEEIQKIVD